MQVATEERRPVSSRTLVRGAAAAFATGATLRAERLVRAFWQGPVTAETAATMELVESAFRGGDEPGREAASRAAAHLVEMGESAAAFAVLAAVATDAWRSEKATGDVAGLALLRRGEVSAALPLLQRAAERMDLRGERGAAVPAYALAGEAAACLGRLTAAVPLLERAAELARTTRQPRWLVRADLAAALIGARRGALTEAHAATVRAALLSSRPDERDRAELVHAVDLAAREEWGDAHDLLAALAHRAGPDLVAWGVLGHLAEAAVHRGRVDEARALVSRVAEAEGLVEDDVTLADLLHATAVLSGPAHVEACFEALLAHDPTRWPWLAARAHLAYGEHLRRRRRVAEARPHLVAARRLFDALAATPGVRRAAGELRAAGVQDPPARDAAPLPLSAQELEIARLAARGMTNRQIGQALHLSPRTVGSHLYRIFPKLDITSRVQLARIIGA